MKRWWLSLFIVIPSLLFLGVEGRIVNNSPFEQTKEMTLLRQIGHLVLLSSGDSTSRVLPVEELSKNKYLIRFERSFKPDPDSVVHIFTNLFKSQHDYAVELKKCEQDSAIHSFVISTDSTSTMMPCLERGLPFGCYYLTISISNNSSPSIYYLAGLGFLLLLVGIWAYRRKQASLPVPTQELAPQIIHIGQFQFYVNERQLELGGAYTELTGKETQLLAILAQSANSIVERERLQKEIWEDEGVIVTRSLDMFISKLRKKLKADPNVRIENVHGKGYKLLIMI